MPRTSQFTKDDIAAKAIEIIREKGADALSARSLGSALGCSSRPLFTVFKNMEELSAYTYSKAEDLFNEYVGDVTNYYPAFKEFGLRLMRFAREEQNLFQYLFLEGNSTMANAQSKAHECLEGIRIGFKLTEKETETLFTQMWIYSCGLAILSIQNSEDFDDEKVSKLLSYHFKATLDLIKTHQEPVAIEPRLRNVKAVNK